MKKKFIVIIIILVLIVLGFTISIMLTKQPVFESDDACNSGCINKGYDEGFCNNGIKGIPIEWKEYDGFGSCLIENDIYCDNPDRMCSCTCILLHSNP